MLLEKLKVFRNGTSWRTELNRENFFNQDRKGERDNVLREKYYARDDEIFSN